MYILAHLLHYLRRSTPALRGLSALVLACLMTAATAASDLYRGEVPVADRTEDARNGAFQSALQQVIDRLAGQIPGDSQSKVKPILAKAGYYVQEYEYVGGEEQNAPLRLVVRFDERALERDLRGSGTEVWGNSRPTILVWLALQENGDRYWLEENEPPDASAAFKAAAGQSGLPMLYPLFDLQDLADVKLADVMGGFDQGAQATLKRYQAQGVLVGSAFRDDKGWSVRWRYYRGDQDRGRSWNSSGVRLADTFSQGISQLEQDLRADRSGNPDRDSTLPAAVPPPVPSSAPSTAVAPAPAATMPATASSAQAWTPTPPPAPTGNTALGPAAGSSTSAAPAGPAPTSSAMATTPSSTAAPGTSNALPPPAPAASASASSATNPSTPAAAPTPYSAATPAASSTAPAAPQAWLPLPADSAAGPAPAWSPLPDDGSAAPEPQIPTSSQPVWTPQVVPGKRPELPSGETPQDDPPLETYPVPPSVSMPPPTAIPDASAQAAVTSSTAVPQPTSFTLVVLGVDSLEDYANLDHYLSGVAVIDAHSPYGLGGGKATFHVDSKAGAEAVLRQLRSGGLMRTPDASMPAPDASSASPDTQYLQFVHR